jgi:cell wall-associated NlpC family hydrolase
VGDQGTSFGLFQLHQGGALPRGTSPQQATNPDWNAQFAARAIKGLGIQGLPVEQQIAQISRRFERPQDPATEISRATDYYRTHYAGQQGAATAPAATPASSAPVVGRPSLAPLPQMSLAPLQQQFTLGAAQNQRALDALGAISGRSVEAPSAPDLSALTQSQTPQLQPAAKPAGITVPLKGNTTPKGLDAAGQKAVALARHYIGVPYVFGGASPKGFDCSGFTQWVHAQLGVKIPRTAAEQFHAGRPVAEKDLQPGDSLFFSENGTIGHTGMYVGNGQFIEAPHTGDSVKVVPLAGHYQQILAGARRYA